LAAGDGTSRDVAPVKPTVIIPVLGAHDLLERCIRSLNGYASRIIIIDNGDALDRDAVTEWISGADVYVWRMPTALSVAASWNLGIKATPFEDGWLLLNSDAWFPDGLSAEYADSLSFDRIVLAGAPPWCCAWIGSEVVRRVGLFCERFHPAYFEDNDYERRAHIVGMEILHSDANVMHENSSTLARNPHYATRNAKTFATNQAFYDYRWANLSADGLPQSHEWSLTTRVRNAWEIIE
jgi:GT2 family glycosyltransferase